RYIVLMDSLPEGDYLPTSWGRICDSLSEAQTTNKVDGLHPIIRWNSKEPAVASDITIGVIDSWIWPESPSNKDDGFGPIPSKWKGECQGGADFPCNKKIIGARYYSIDNLSFSARDYIGHGTHAASIAAGNYMKGSSYYGSTEGVAKGGVPSMRLAVYKVCKEHCHTTDILSAFDDAIADGEDGLSVSVAFDDAVDVTEDPVAIGSLHALKRNILTSVVVGNNGPHLGSIQNSAPWMITTGVSYMDCRIMGKLLLGKESILVVWQGVNAFPSSYRESPFGYEKEVTSTCSETDARNCLPQCFESGFVEQKVVFVIRLPTYWQLTQQESSALLYLFLKNKVFL
nr:subtilisin-like protease SBT4.3 [Tanacetum cinerariifolium]